MSAVLRCLLKLTLTFWNHNICLLQLLMVMLRKAPLGSAIWEIVTFVLKPAFLINCLCSVKISEKPFFRLLQSWELSCGWSFTTGITTNRKRSAFIRLIISIHITPTSSKHTFFFQQPLLKSVRAWSELILVLELKKEKVRIQFYVWITVNISCSPVFSMVACCPYLHIFQKWFTDISV